MLTWPGVEAKNTHKWRKKIAGFLGVELLKSFLKSGEILRVSRPYGSATSMQNFLQFYLQNCPFCFKGLSFCLKEISFLRQP